MKPDEHGFRLRLQGGDGDDDDWRLRRIGGVEDEKGVQLSLLAEPRIEIGQEVYARGHRAGQKAENRKRANIE